MSAPPKRSNSSCEYRGRLAPTPTGYLHLGHGRTFFLAAKRAEEAGGALIFRIEDLDPQRCRPEFVQAALEDLRWLGLRWHEGPDRGGPCAPYAQSARTASYLKAWARLRDAGAIYPCRRSRRELRETAAVTPPSPLDADEQDAEPLYPPAWRPPLRAGCAAAEPSDANWRFRVPDGRVIAFDDAVFGPCTFVAGRDFGDFVVRRRDGVPAYELAVVVDDAAMGITEVVRGADLLRSTARQILLAEALGLKSPSWCHLPLVRDADGQRLAKRTAGLSLRELKAAGLTPQEVLKKAGVGLGTDGAVVGALHNLR